MKFGRSPLSMTAWLPRAVSHPAAVGAVYVLSLAAWAARTPAVDERTGGAQAQQLEAFVRGRFGGEITRVGIAVVAAALAFGAVLGSAASGLLALRRWMAGRGARESDLRAVALETLRVLALVAALHAAIETWSMAHDPSLYADVWYAAGGWRRTWQVLATDVLGPGGVLALCAIAAVAFVLGPPSGWPGAFSRMRDVGRRLRRRLPAAAAVLASIAGCAALARLAWIPSAGAAPAPGAGAPSAGAPSTDARPNVLLLAADSLRADRLVPRIAPALSALADRGTRFERAYVSIPRTFPSWVTILTGRSPHHHGIRSMFPRWEERARDFDALPERLARAGYATGVVSDYAGDVFSRIDLGFDRVDVPDFDFRQLVRQRALERETPLMPVLHSRFGRAAFPVMREMNDAADPALLASDAVRAMRRLEGRGKPFFLLVFFSTAHFPYAAPAPYYRRFTDDAYRGRYKYDKPVGLGTDAAPDARDRAQVRALYDGAVAAVDDGARRILDALASDGIARRTVVVVTADHGETLYEGDHGIGHGDHLFGDEGTHVPFVVVDPRKAAPHADGTGPAPSAGPRQVDAIVRDVDLAPTLYALTGTEPPADLDGRSLAPALDGQPLAPRHAYAESELWFTEEIPGLPGELRLPYPGVARLTELDTQHGDEVVLQRAAAPVTLVARHRMVRDERWKLVYVPTRTGVRWMLFDTAADPEETRDVAALHPDVAARLQADLWNYMLQDPGMTERGGYLVPAGARDAAPGDPGLLRLGD